MTETRRGFIGAGAAGVAAVALGAGFWDELFASARVGARSRRSGYGRRRPPDRLGLRLPRGFRARLIARGGERVPGTGYVWHEASDGMATFATGDGGWILVSNAELVDGGGVSAIRFGPDGRVGRAYRILEGTRRNCSGGATPWGTWLSCEEVDDGLVWECDPAGRRAAVARPALGVFRHEAAAVDPRGRRIYLTEDIRDGRLYRFSPARWPDLRRGLLEVATVRRGGVVRWTEVPDPAAARVPTREQIPRSTRFRRAEGIWHDDGVIYVATSADRRVHAYDTRRGRIEVLYDGPSARGPELRVDQLIATRAGEVFVCEDVASGPIDVGLIDRTGRVSRFLTATGAEHEGSELTGVTFDPSGRRMYFASQRAGGAGGTPGPGAVYEVSGPFRAG